MWKHTLCWTAPPLSSTYRYTTHLWTPGLQSAGLWFSSLLLSTLLCSALFYPTPPYSTRLYSVLYCTLQLLCNLLYNTLLLLFYLSSISALNSEVCYSSRLCLLTTFFSTDVTFALLRSFITFLLSVLLCHSLCFSSVPLYSLLFVSLLLYAVLLYSTCVCSRTLLCFALLCHSGTLSTLHFCLPTLLLHVFFLLICSSRLYLAPLYSSMLCSSLPHVLSCSVRYSSLLHCTLPLSVAVHSLLYTGLFSTWILYFTCTVLLFIVCCTALLVIVLFNSVPMYSTAID